jgi:HEAT repeat protein
MKTKRLRIIFVVLIAAVVCGVVWQVSRARGPVYQGKRLSVWLKNYDPNPVTPFATRAEADEAVRQIGTNAIPMLLRLLQANDPPWKLKVFALLDKQRFIKINPFHASKLNWEAMSAFGALGPGAADAVPALIEIFERNISKQSRSAAAGALGAIGPAAKSAIPVLLKGMTNSDINLRANLLYALGRIRSAPELVVPVLCDSLKDKRSFVSVCAVQALGDFGAGAKPAIPALVKLLQDQNSDIRANATNALKKIDPEAAAKAGVN